ncbi:aminopeptidase [Ammoniphilus sp. CFH 90114]|uniref:aminopeptidase n=1 Tax=Ammoniphilus sp. CFH 90114 TaxID=2493665 RepID=UPI00100DB027|nr:aminopeptidase [Ammoniphilus sp. CFH 90114]RXT13491.1 aminopeptidase [Ammoniphilus sp. CFH 90114]
MKDPRLSQLAKNLIQYSTQIQPGEKVLIEMRGEATDLLRLVVKEVYAAGGFPYVQITNPQVVREIMLGASDEQLTLQADLEIYRMKQMDAYIGIRADANINEYADVPSDKIKRYNSLVTRPVNDIRVPHTKWVVLRYPNSSMAQLANTSTEAFEDFYFQVCNLDYSKMSEAMDGLVNLMNQTDEVHVKGEGTDLRFSIKNIPAIKCAGNLNIPDGEVFTAPVRDSVNGVITYNTPSPYNGYTFENVRLVFKDGKIIEATANDTARINEIFDADEGARYIGEFAIGVNPYIQHPMKDILFDEKIDGSFHFTPGNCYDEAPNGNKSSVHWDLVNIQRPEYGGGEMWFDGRLIRKDGRFVIPELEALNPENLK